MFHNLFRLDVHDEQINIIFIIYYGVIIR